MAEEILDGALPKGSDTQTVSTEKDSYDIASKEYLDALQKMNQALSGRNQMNLFNVAGAFFDPGRTGQFSEALGRASSAMGKDLAEQQALAPSIAQMRASIASKSLDTVRESKLREASQNFIANPKDPKALADIMRYSTDPTKTLADLAKSAPQVRRLLGGANETPSPFQAILANENISPEIRGVAMNYEKQYQDGTMDPDKAPQFAENIIKMMESAGKAEDANYLRWSQERDRVERDANKIIDASKPQITAANSALDQVNVLKDQIEKLGESGVPTAGHPMNQILANLPSWVPFSDTEQKDFVRQIETLKSKNFLTGIQAMKGFGALSNAEGAKVETSIANLSTDMSFDQFKKEIKKIEKSIDIMKNEAQAKIDREQARIERYSTPPKFGGAPRSTVATSVSSSLDEALEKRGLKND